MRTLWMISAVEANSMSFFKLNFFVDFRVHIHYTPIYINILNSYLGYGIFALS